MYFDILTRIVLEETTRVSNEIRSTIDLMRNEQCEEFRYNIMCKHYCASGRYLALKDLQKLLRDSTDYVWQSDSATKLIGELSTASCDNIIAKIGYSFEIEMLLRLYEERSKNV